MSPGEAGLPRAAAAVPPDAASRPGLADLLGFRLAALLAVALLPLGMAGFLQVAAWREAAREQTMAALMSETLEAVAPEAGMIREAQGLVAALARAIPVFRDDPAACDAALTAIADSMPHISLVAYVPADGRMRCASGAARGNFADNPVFRTIIERRAPHIVVNADGPISLSSILVVSHPVAGPDAQMGFVSVSIPHDSLALATGQQAEIRPDPAQYAFVTFNRDGVLLTASTGLATAEHILPAGLDLSSLAGSAARTFDATTADGESRHYAVVPLIPGEVYALGSTPERPLRIAGWPVAAPFLVIGLMWAGSLVVAWLAAERLVTRYMRRLARAIRAFASGSRVVAPLEMSRAPAEIRDVAQAFLRMTDTILHDEAELEDALHQKEVLLREVHHRVKNNLQLIASIMNMQMRRARNPETLELMQGLQERVMSLATVHKELYQTSGQADVRADELLADIVRQILGMASAPGRAFRVTTDFAPLHLPPDQAVPLALLLTEGLTNAIKYAAAPPGETEPHLALRFAKGPDGRAELEIRNSAGPAAPAAEPVGTGLGRQLLAAFAAQIGGDLTQDHEGDQHRLCVRFALGPAGQGVGPPGAAAPAGREPVRAVVASG
ncbi:sensor histidine kinase [Rubellimicrobium sp. CFH 75288]|uniref:sensor histidine kinase n=1 Tax=Rubellimicrobium sp. CFH 75288 TaxID=2697034 RepID=UPI001412EFCD|nr:histidine kinase dimerization/phosphoacceptor domain -containing protein [Rubellimicrobium sp. CFH 75288]NAZ37412.1 HAMP domain-containing protein [Rubellimicrobium sp. CFH 75288]